MSNKTHLIALCSLLLTSPLSHARDRPFIDEIDDTTNNDYVEKEWLEHKIDLPDGYQQNNLQEFQVDTSSGNFRYFIDASSLRTTADDVSRFSLVIRSSSGVDNSSYEGLRCGKRQYRVYAYGGNKGFKMMPGSEWKHINRSGQDNYRNTLYNDLICNSSTGKANSPEDVLNAMKRNKKIQSSSFIQD